MKIIKLGIFLILGLILGIGLGVCPFLFVSPHSEDSGLEARNYQMIYIFYNISKSDKECDSLYKYYESSFLYFPWITATYINSHGVPILHMESATRIPLLSENDFSKICNYKLMGNSELVDKYDSRIKLKKVPLDGDAPLTFKRLGFSCLFNDISPWSKLREDFPARYFLSPAKEGDHK